MVTARAKEDEVLQGLNGITLLVDRKVAERSVKDPIVWIGCLRWYYTRTRPLLDKAVSTT
jgi:hypothetical protein